MIKKYLSFIFLGILFASTTEILCKETATNEIIHLNEQEFFEKIAEQGLDTCIQLQNSIDTLKSKQWQKKCMKYTLLLGWFAACNLATCTHLSNFILVITGFQLLSDFYEKTPVRVYLDPQSGKVHIVDCTQ